MQELEVKYPFIDMNPTAEDLVDWLIYSSHNFTKMLIR